jgi:hypothetical protein
MSYSGGVAEWWRTGARERFVKPDSRSISAVEQYLNRLIKWDRMGANPLVHEYGRPKNGRFWNRTGSPPNVKLVGARERAEQQIDTEPPKRRMLGL